MNCTHSTDGPGLLCPACAAALQKLMDDIHADNVRIMKLVGARRDVRQILSTLLRQYKAWEDYYNDKALAENGLCDAEAIRCSAIKAGYALMIEPLLMTHRELVKKHQTTVN